MRVLVFGDSITQGYWDADGGWVNILRKKYDTQYIEGQDPDPPTIFNLGISADSSGDVLARFENETKARARPEVAFIIAIGVNDARIELGTNFSTTDQYAQNLIKILTSARKYSDKVLIVGLTPAAEPRSTPVPWDVNVHYTNARIKEFDKALQTFCQQNTVAYVEIFTTFQAAESKSELLPDSLHPNTEGHQLIASMVEPALEKLLQ